MAYADFRHRHPLRVRWAEVDLQGVVFNAHYLAFADVCVNEYWRALGVRYPQDFHALGQDTFVRKATVDYLEAARYDDELELCGRSAALGRSSLRFVVELHRRGGGAGDGLARMELVYVNVALDGHRPAPWPDAFRGRVRAFEVVPPEEPHAGG